MLANAIANLQSALTLPLWDISFAKVFVALYASIVIRETDRTPSYQGMYNWGFDINQHTNEGLTPYQTAGC